jgi:hypothetical protein
MKKEKYYVSVMRPVYQRAVIEVHASTGGEAREQALKKAKRFSDDDWSAFGMTVSELAVTERSLPAEEFKDDSDALEFFADHADYAYALLQANIGTGEGDIIAPRWLADCSALMVADLTSDWLGQLQDIHEEGVTGFLTWLKKKKGPANIIDFSTAREKLRGKRRHDPDSER